MDRVGKHLAQLLPLPDAPLGDDGDRELPGHGLQQGQAGDGGAQGVLGVAAEGGAHQVETQGLGAPGLLQGGAVRHKQLPGVALPQGEEELLQALALGPGPGGGVQGDDFRPRLEQGLHLGFGGGDVHRAAGVLRLDDANHRQGHLPADGGDILHAVGPDAHGAALLGGLGHGGHHAPAVEGLPRQGLAGDDYPPVELVEHGLL